MDGQRVIQIANNLVGLLHLFLIILSFLFFGKCHIRGWILGWPFAIYRSSIRKIGMGQKFIFPNYALPKGDKL